MRSEVESTLNAYFFKKFKNATEDGYPVTQLYTIIAKPTQLDMDSPDIQRLMMRITAIHMGSRLTKYINLTQLFNPIFQLCLYCKEDQYIERLNSLWAKGTIGLSIPDLERKISRGGAVPRVNGKLVKFDAMNYSYKQIEQELDLIYFNVCIHNNIKISVDIGQMLAGLNKE